MNFKNILLTLLLLIIAIPVANMTEDKYQQITSAKLIYTNGELPDFKAAQDLNPRLYLSMVRLENADGQFFCSGAVISDDYVLTAAHCLAENKGIFPGMRKNKFRITSMTTPNGGTLSVDVHAAAMNTRADYALVKGDFRQFTKLRVFTKPDILLRLTTRPQVCGFPWGASPICYPTGGQLITYYERFSINGVMYPGMSGGPVLTEIEGAVGAFAVNMGVGSGAIFISPLIGLFETLGVKVIN